MTYLISNNTAYHYSDDDVYGLSTEESIVILTDNPQWLLDQGLVSQIIEQI